MDEDPAPWGRGLPQGGRASAGDAQQALLAPRPRGAGAAASTRRGTGSRRGGGGAAPRTGPMTRPQPGPPPSPAGRDAGQASRTGSFEVPDFPGPDDGGTGPLAWRDEVGGYDPRAPWERGDSS